MIHLPAASDGRASHLAPDRLTRIAMGYLALPLFLYFPGWFQAAPALILSLLFGYACWRALAPASLAPTPWPRRRLIALALAVAVGWSAFGGAGHFFHAIAHDWVIRDAVLRDLVVASWPPSYLTGGEDPHVLRAPVAYYLPAAAVAKFVGLRAADKLLWLWTVAGIALFLLLLPLRGTTTLRALAGMLLVVLFSGMDIVGYMFPDFHWGNFPLPGAFIDWWIKPPPMVSYWSNTANLFWNPNHSLPAWISVALFYRHWRHPGFQAISPLLVAILPLWSPFALIGMAPFLFLQFVHWWRGTHRHALDLPVIAACAAIFGVVFVTLTIPFSGIQLGMSLTTPPEVGGWFYMNDVRHLLTYVENYTLFVIFEFGIIALLVSRSIDRQVFSTAVITLLALPMFSLGPGNDLAMRGSIPSLGVLCIAAVNLLARPGPADGFHRRWLLGLVLAIGAVTPYFEISRAVSRQSWPPNLDFTLIDADNGQVAPHYLVPLARSPLRAAMNASVPMPNAVDWLRFCKSRHPRNVANKAYVAFAWRNNRNDAEVRAEAEVRRLHKVDCGHRTRPANPATNVEVTSGCP